ncbi:arginyltransferase [Lampropedia puyangensis]|uniref:Aspartate/glutamate leucyltransferase n=1 Tax=Lampropedia puyangensis TaxID=1330072 RepID=A0A4S8F889_9BURK|nr:arginyltransferase [Lampropedia puyangensis]THU02504.1 arginyltransferase [Lampropedia puyangensis]
MNESAHYPLQFYATAPYPCSYLPAQTARSQVASPGELVDGRVYSLLVERGFRRSGLFTYRPYCDACQACQTLRIPVDAFTPTRSQRRAWRDHAHLQARLLPPELQPAHYALYQRYLKARHSQAGMDNDDPADYEQFLLSSRVDTRLLEFSETALDATRAPILRMVSVVDVLDKGISAVYTFYDTDAAKGMGTYSILWLIQWAKRLGLPYVYLGYWIADSAKMAYKANFHPHEILQAGTWIRVHGSKAVNTKSQDPASTVIKGSAS